MLNLFTNTLLLHPLYHFHATDLTILSLYVVTDYRNVTLLSVVASLKLHIRVILVHKLLGSPEQNAAMHMCRCAKLLLYYLYITDLADLVILYIASSNN